MLTKPPNPLEIIRQVLCSPAVLAELRSRFEGVGSIFVSGALAGTLASRDQDGPLELPRDIKAHTMLVMCSSLLSIVSTNIFSELRVYLIRPPCLLQSLPFAAYVHISLPTHSSTFRMDSASFLSLHPPPPPTDTTEDGFAGSLGCGVCKRSHTVVSDTADGSQETSARKSKRKRAKAKAKQMESLCMNSALSLRDAASASTIGRWGELPLCLPILVSMNSAVYLGIDEQTPDVGPQ
ncbi:hypothetical protein AB1N83_010117 [Pleurotus pulmonarius]